MSEGELLFLGIAGLAILFVVVGLIFSAIKNR